MYAQKDAMVLQFSIANMSPNLKKDSPEKQGRSQISGSPKGQADQ
jgi:hypothetical protein